MQINPEQMLYQAALAAPVFQSPTGKVWALIPQGTEAPHPVPIRSQTYRDWLHNRAEEKAGLKPTQKLLSGVAKARRCDAVREPGEPALRIVQRANKSIYLHLGSSEGECLRISPEGWDITPPPSHVHFRYPENHLPLPQPIQTDSYLPTLLAPSFGPTSAIAVAKWLVKALVQAKVVEVLLFTGPRRFEAARALLDLLDPRLIITRTPCFEDDWLLFCAEFSQLTAAQIDQLNFSAQTQRPVIVTAAGKFAGMDNCTEINVPEFVPLDESEVLGALASAVCHSLRADKNVVASPLR